MKPEEQKLIKEGFTKLLRIKAPEDTGLEVYNVPYSEAETALKMARRYAWLRGWLLTASAYETECVLSEICESEESLDAYIDEQIEKEKNED